MGKGCDCVIVGWKNENGKRVPVYKKKSDKKDKSDKSKNKAKEE